MQFEDSSYGYRPGRSQHQCLGDLGRTIQQRRVNYIVEANIRRFFNTVDHDWMREFLGHRIGDPRIIRLIARLLKGGILEDGLVQASEEGTPQGSILSPLLSNIYLHDVLDLWFSRRVRPQSRGEAYYFRFADDFVAGFQYRQEAEDFQADLGERLGQFKRRLAEEKTRCLARGEKPEEFTFLGFTHYCGKSKKGYFKVKRRTSRKKLGASLRAFRDWARRARHKQTTGEMLVRAKARVQGHLNYYAITDNARSGSRYVYHATRILRRWLNRKSQRKAYNWDQYNDVLREVGWPRVPIRIDLNPFRRAEAG